MFGDLLVAYGDNLVIAIIGVAVGLLLLVVVLWVIRGRAGSSPFVRGGKNRQPRLQVLDAAAVDTRRRLVLVRRDDVEHLVMIGGPTDIVIESGISASRHTQQSVSVRSGLPHGNPTAVAARDLDTRPQPSAETRSVPPQRPAAALAPVETRAAPLPETVMPTEPARAVRAVQPSPVATPTPPTATTPARPAPAAAMASTVADVAAPAPRIEPTVRPAAEPRVAVPINAAILPPVLQPAAERPKQLGNDFEKMLEQEMAANLAARESAVAPQIGVAPQPRNPAAPKIVDASPEPAQRSDASRIFGGMSATRDK